jgi:hypothetical protein
MKFKGIIGSEFSGSLAGVTASHNRGGYYLRQRVIPTDPNTGPQQLVKGLMATLASRWATSLTQEQRDAWELYGANTPTLNALGESIHLTGQQWYNACNVPRMNAGLARVDDGPTTYGLALLTPPTMVADDTPEVSISYTNTDLWATEVGGALLVQVARQVAPTIFFFKGPFIYTARANGAVSPPTSPLLITSTLPSALTLGNALFVRIRAVNADGRISTPIILRTIIAAS